MLIAFLSLVPVFYKIRNSEQNFKDTELKKLAEKRRARLDKEHGVERDQITDSFEQLDQIYRVSEKEELQKVVETGQSPKKYMELKEGIQSPEIQS